MSDEHRLTAEPMASDLHAYLRCVVESLEKMPCGPLEQMIVLLHGARLRRANLFICGNGGSAATAAHLVNDLNKGANVAGMPRFRAVGLVDNTPLLTAWSNDSSYAEGFTEQLRNFCRPTDLLIAFSGSGNSPNVLSAVAYAHEVGATTIGLAGRDGGQLARMADLALVVPNSCMEQIEDLHLFVCHALVSALRARAQSAFTPSLLLADGYGAYPGMPATDPAAPKRPAIFLDRDGVINANRLDHVKCWEEFTLLPGTLAALEQLARVPMPIIVITNQAAINRQLMSYEVAESINRRLMAAVAAAGGRIDAVAWCPHRPDEHCGCRKPETGLLTYAAAALSLDLTRSYLVGDAEADIAAGMASGCKTALVLTGRGTTYRPVVEARWGAACPILRDLAAAAQWILDDREAVIHATR